DACGPKCVTTRGIGEGGSLRPPLYHVEDVKAGHCFVGELVAPVHAAEKPRLLGASDICSPDVGVQVVLKAGMAGYLMPFAALFIEPEPPALPVLEIIANPHRYRRAHPGERVYHDADQCPVAQTHQGGGLDRVEQ